MKLLTHRSQLLALTVALPLVAACGGCGALGALAYKFSPPVVVEPAYIPVQEPMVVFVERSENPADAQTDTARIARYIQDRLEEHRVAPMVDPAPVTTNSGLQTLRRVGDPPPSSPRRTTPLEGPSAPSAYPAPSHAPSPPPVESWAIEAPRYLPAAARGWAAGAKQVLYVDLIDFTVEPALGSDMINASADARVRVIDVATGATRWPTDTTQGYTLTVTTPHAKLDGRTGDLPVREEVSQKLAERVAQLFYRYTTEQVDEGSPMLHGSP